MCRSLAPLLTNFDSLIKNEKRKSTIQTTLLHSVSLLMGSVCLKLAACITLSAPCCVVFSPCSYSFSSHALKNKYKCNNSSREPLILLVGEFSFTFSLCVTVCLLLCFCFLPLYLLFSSHSENKCKIYRRCIWCLYMGVVSGASDLPCGSLFHCQSVCLTV